MFVVAHCLPHYQDLDGDAAASVESLAMSWNALTPGDWFLRRNDMTGQPVMHVRNLLVEWALADAPLRAGPSLGERATFNSRVLDEVGPPADVLLWQDADISFNVPEALELIAVLQRAPEHVAMVGAPCMIRSREGPAAANVNFNGYASSLPLVRDQRICAEVAQVGFGLVACRASAYKALPFPWHDFKYADGDIRKIIGEDGGWCDAVRRLGFSIFAHGGVLPWHSFSRRFRLTPESDAWLALSGASPREA